MQHISGIAYETPFGSSQDLVVFVVAFENLSTTGHCLYLFERASRGKVAISEVVDFSHPG